MTVHFSRYGTTSRVETPDGSWISFREIGEGPPIILVHGLMGASHTHWDLAQILARRYAVILPDRRGRGDSGPAGIGDPLQCESDDLALLMNHCKVRACIGISLGAIIALEAASRCSSTGPVVIFDPPLSIGGSPSLKWLTRYRADLASGDRVGALVTAMLGTQMGPPGMRMIPRFLLKLMTRHFAKSEEASAPPHASMLDLVSTLERDVDVVTAAADGVERFRVSTPVLLLGSERSPAYFRRALEELSRVLPDARSIELKGLGHDAANNRDLGGSPERIAEHILPFLLSRLAPSADAAFAPVASAQSQVSAAGSC